MRILFLTHRLPYAADRGDRIRSFNILKYLAGRADVDLVSLVHSREEAAHAVDLEKLVTTVRIAPVSRGLAYGRALAALGTGRAFTHAMLYARAADAACRQAAAAHPPDLIFSYCTGVAPLALGPGLSSVPLVLDMVDVDSEKWSSLGQSGSPPASWLYASEARRMQAFERRVAGAAHTVLVVNERERDALVRLAPGARVIALHNGIDVAAFQPPGGPVASRRVTFCGVLNYRPNEEAVIWFAQRVWPRVRSRRPDARLSLVGSDPTGAVRRLAEDPTIEVTGRVPDTRPYLWDSAAAIAPIFVARGVQNKVLEAVAAGLPCVVTPAVRDGLPASVLPACRVAADAEPFADAVLALLDRSPAERRAIAGSADLQSLRWEDQLAPLMDILKAAAASPASATPISTSKRRFARSF